MRNIVYLAVIALVLGAASIGLLWVFDVIAQADALDYAVRVGGAIVIVVVAAALVVGISGRGGKTPTTPQA
ncbi:MAG TPA: hypothetical protein VJH94_03470 [Candidatus Paceibacterota bacterium]